MEDSEIDTVYNVPRISPGQSTSDVNDESEHNSRLQAVKVV